MNKQQRKSLRKNSILGGFLLVGLVALTVLTFYLTGFSVKGRDKWTVYFGADSLIRSGYEISVSGKKSGLVESVELVPDGEVKPGRYVKAILALEKGLSLWEGAEVIVSARGLLGGFNIEVLRGDPQRRRIQPGTVLPGRVEGSVFDQLSDVVSDNRTQLDAIASNLAEVTEKVNSGKGTLGRLLTDDEIYNNLLKMSQSLADASASLQSNDSTIGKLLRDSSMFDDLAATAKNMRTVTDDLQAGRGTVGRLLKENDIAESLAEAAGALRNIMVRLDRGEGALGKLLKEDQVATDLAAGVKALREFAERINTGEGTLSLLMTDKEVYENLRVLTDNLKAVSEQVRSGKGTLGLLLTDDSLYREAQRLLESFRESGEIARENAPISSLTSFTSLFFNVLN